jgi:DNA-binding transcriptional LysR family regulator
MGHVEAPVNFFFWIAAVTSFEYQKFLLPIPNAASPIFMRLRQIRYFIAVAECLSLSKATKKLGITVPPLSRHIRQLEQELKTQLFLRGRRGVALTAAGHQLLREAKVLMTQVARVSDGVRMAKTGKVGLVRVGVGFALGDRVSRVLIEHSNRFPGVEIQCKSFFSSLQIDALLNREIDVGFLRLPIDEVRIASERLFEERLIVTLSKANPLAKRRYVRIQDLAGERLLMPDRSSSASLHDKTFELYRRAGVKPNVTVLGPGLSAGGDVQAILAACGKGIFIMPDEISCHPPRGSAVVAVPLAEPDARIQVHLCWRKSEKSVATLSFLNTARRVLRNPRLRTSLVTEDRSKPAAMAG